MGPGLITGASDDDPSGIATYAQAGAQFGYRLGWTMVLTYPLMVCIQEISARLGRVTGAGIGGSLRRLYPSWVVLPVVGLLVTANVINVAADLGAMGDAVRMIVGGPRLAYVAAFAGASILLEVFVRYARYATLLKWLTISLFAYVVTVFAVGVPWGTVLRGLLVPDISWDTNYLTTVVAVLGTTISPYLFFWQAAEEADDIKEDAKRQPLLKAPTQAPDAFRRIHSDTVMGMGFSNIVALAIMLTTAATLHTHGVTDIQTATQAAEALRPIAGRFAFLVFSMGIIGTGLLAIPVLAGSAAYALGEALDRPVGLALLPWRARTFYGTIIAATGIGALLNFTPMDPIKALFWSAVFNGLAAAPVMIMVMLVTSSRRIMGDFTLPPWLKIGGWLATALMAVASIAMLVTL